MNHENPGTKTLLLNGSSGSTGLVNLIESFKKLGPSFGLNISAYIPSFSELINRPISIKEYPLVAQKLNHLDAEKIVVFGGRRTALVLEEVIPDVKKSIGLVPVTVENDLWACERSLGFSSAVEFAFRNYQDRDIYHNDQSDILILEIAGHESGFLVLETGMALGAQTLVFPENPETADMIAKKYKIFRQKSSDGKISRFLVVVNEGISPGRSFDLAENLRKAHGLNPEVVIIAPMQRHCHANAEDVLLAAKYSAKCCEYLSQGKSGFMVGYSNGKFNAVDVTSVAQELKKPALGLLRLARELYC
ncbi:MAG: hypothetical protein A4S09_11800 [Proteobacteria bacterium SG_bin7]|nr:MAG: hypothetical protein A4S09_11800 [Proteobacteria bacterium SG_bin7]